MTWQLNNNNRKRVKGLRVNAHLFHRVFFYFYHFMQLFVCVCVCVCVCVSYLGMSDSLRSHVAL